VPPLAVLTISSPQSLHIHEAAGYQFELRVQNPDSIKRPQVTFSREGSIGKTRICQSDSRRQDRRKRVSTSTQAEIETRQPLKTLLAAAFLRALRSIQHPYRMASMRAPGNSLAAAMARITCARSTSRDCSPRNVFNSARHSTGCLMSSCTERHGQVRYDE